MCVLGAGVLLCRGLPERALLAVTAIGFLLAIPWIPLNMLAAGTWAVLTGRALLDEERPRPGSRRPIMPPLLLGLAAGAVSAVWVFTADASRTLVLPFEKPAIWFAAPIIVALAAINSLSEEAIWRSALFRATAGLSRGWVYGLQAVSFGVAHFGGIPGGWIGVALAGVFAVIATAVRSSWGFRAAVVLHFTADVVIFTAVFINADSIFIGISP